MSLYGQYIKEREAFEIIEYDYGFATYKILGKDLYIRDIFIQKEHRNNNLLQKGFLELENIAKSNDCSKLIGTIVPSSPGSTHSMQIQLHLGFKLKSSANDFIVMEKDL